MSNTLLTPKIYANVMLKLLKNNLVMGKLVTTEFNNMFKPGIGSTVYIKRPPEFIVREGPVAQAQNVVEGEVPVVLDRQRGVDIQFTSNEETLTVDQLLKSEIMNSRAAQLAQQIDSDLMSMVLQFPNWVGTPGQLINSPSDYFLAPNRLDLLAIPQSGRNGVLSPNDYWALASFFTTPAFNDNNTNLDALRIAKLPMLGNVSPYQTQSVINLTTGTRVTSGGAQVNGANQNVNYVDVSGSPNYYTQTFLLKNLVNGNTIKAGEVFSIDNVFSLNPRTKANTGALAQFVVLADVTVVGTTATVTIANPMIIANTAANAAYATINAAPADSAAVTWLGALSTAYAQNAVFHKSAIALVFAQLSRPYSGQYDYATDPETGVSLRYWMTSDGTNDTHLHRVDVLYGVNNIDRRLGTRQSGVA